MADRRDVQLPVRVMPELLERIDGARGDVSRTRWVTRALGSGSLHTARGPAPTRAPVSSDVGNESAAPAASVVAPTGSSPERPPLKRGSEIVLRFRCPDVKCPRRFGSAAAVCPEHARKAVEAT